MSRASSAFTMTCPDDWHIHLRDKDMLRLTVPHAAAQFHRVIVMPNLAPPVTTTDAALAYHQRIMAHVPQGTDFVPLMTLYLTDQTPPEEIVRAKASGRIFGVKLYPAGATTHSQAGVTHLNRLTPTLAKMAELGLPLLIHGEVTDPDIDIFDRERVFLERVLEPLIRRFPELRIVLEHITTAEAVDFVTNAPPTLAATITAHHLLLNRNDMLAGGIRPHHYCLPVIKRERHRQALVAAATGTHRRFFLGTDSAPHRIEKKESACGCAGIYTACHALSLYAEVFEQAQALHRLEDFASHRGADFYGLPRNPDKMTLTRIPTAVPDQYDTGTGRVVPLRAGQHVAWQCRRLSQPVR